MKAAGWKVRRRDWPADTWHWMAVKPDWADEATALVDAEEAAKLCEQKLMRPGGHDGRWEGYGPFQGDKTGPECAAEIRQAAK